MRIGILTYHWVFNFGANLQTLATINFLRSQGHIPIVINYRPQKTENWYNSIVNPVEIDAFNKYSSRFYYLTDRCEGIEEVKKQIEKFGIESVIIGSDSLFNLIKPYFQWRRPKIIKPGPDHVFPNPFWGNLGCKYAGLSISSQNCNYKKFKRERQEIGEALMAFEYLSVRDNWTQEMVSYLTFGERIPKVTPDPVFSFNKYGKDLILPKSYIMERFNLKGNYILYNPGDKIFSRNWIDSFKTIVNREGLDLVRLPHTLSGEVEHIKWPVDPIEWYSLIVHSVGYMGILMHPIIVCLHNSTPFFSIDHYGLSKDPLKSSKIYHIIEQAGFLDNYYNLILGGKFPKPETVWKALISFDKKKCTEFAKKQEIDCIRNYYTALNAIL